MAQVLITAAFLCALTLNGTLTTYVTLPVLGTVDFGYAFYPISFLLIIGMVNAVNLTDGIDGLSSSVTFVVMLGFLFVASFLGNTAVALFAAAIAVAVQAFSPGIFTRQKPSWATRAACFWGAPW